MTQWHTSSQGLEDTLTYVELVNSFIIAEIRILALAKWSGLRGSWEGIRNLVRSIAEWQSQRLGTAPCTQIVRLPFLFCLPPSHLFERVFFVTCDSGTASSLHFSLSICELCKTDKDSDTQMDFPLVRRLVPHAHAGESRKRHSSCLSLIVWLWEWHACHCSHVAIGWILSVSLPPLSVCFSSLVSYFSVSFADIILIKGTAFTWRGFLSKEGTTTDTDSGAVFSLCWLR